MTDTNTQAQDAPPQGQGDPPAPQPTLTEQFRDAIASFQAAQSAISAARTGKDSAAADLANAEAAVVAAQASADNAGQTLTDTVAAGGAAADSLISVINAWKVEMAAAANG